MGHDTVGESIRGLKQWGPTPLCLGVPRQDKRVVLVRPIHKGTSIMSSTIARVPARNVISAYFHCTNCLDNRPKGTSPAEWVRLEAGFTKDGLQIRCQRCDLNICHIDFEGHRHPANFAGTDLEEATVN
jgi:hypothetical protein